MREITDAQQKAVAMLAVNWTNFTKAQAQLYQEMLADIPGALLQKAVLILIKTSTFLPTVAEIRQKAAEIYRLAEGREAPCAEKAWSDVLSAISRYGANRKPRFSDPICEAAVAYMGWASICMSPTENVSIIRAQFCRFYEAEAERQRKKQEIRESVTSAEMFQLLETVGGHLELQKGRNENEQNHANTESP